MSKPVTFSGKPSQLDNCLTYVQAKIAADGIDADEQKAGLLASLLRGPALSWLSQQMRGNDSFLEDYHELREQLKHNFGIAPEVQKLQASRQLSGLRQKGSVRDYALKFSQLADEAGLNAETKLAFFQEGLKRHIKEALIVKNLEQTYEIIVTEAERVDDNLFYSKDTSRRHEFKQNRGKDGKFKPKVKYEH